MKKLTALILTFVFAFSMICANAELPKFLTEEYNNYTADYSFTVTFESSDELVELLKELEMPEEVENFVDIKALLSSILSQGMQMNLQADISEDFRKAELALTADTQYNVTVNNNLSIGADTKMGMWMKIDLDAEIPVFEVIYSSPVLNKYMVIDAFEAIPDDAAKIEMLEYLNSVFNRDFMESTREFSSKLLEEYADIKISGATCTVKLDNEALIAMINECMQFVSDEVTALMPDTYTDEEIVYNDFPQLGDIQILGEKGITYKYSLVSGKVSSIEMSADISIDISKIAESMGEEWLYESKGILDFVINSNVKMTKIGSTKVVFPTLTEENSFTPMDMIPEYSEPEYEYEDTPEYPYFYTSAYTQELPVINDEIYVPLRAIMEDAYSDTVSFEYADGIVTARCEYFPGFTMLKVTENSELAFTDATKHKVSKVIIKNGTTYVGRSLLEELFGWEMDSAMHDILYNEYYVSFYTSNY